MDVVLISKDQFELLDEKLNKLNNHLGKITAPAEQIIDNKAFLSLMNISPGTAQIWRDEGKIGFVQEGKKIYYRRSDIDEFLKNNYRKPFAYSD